MWPESKTVPRPILTLKSRPLKRPAVAEDCPHCQGGWYQYFIALDAHRCVKCGHTKPVTEQAAPEHTERFTWPESWTKGQLLNIRRGGDDFVVTLLNEEYDPEHPERSLRFANPFDCQEFISFWYDRGPAGR
jgi:hypothetical protein